MHVYIPCNDHVCRIYFNNSILYKTCMVMWILSFSTMLIYIHLIFLKLMMMTTNSRLLILCEGMTGIFPHKKDNIGESFSCHCIITIGLRRDLQAPVLRPNPSWSHVFLGKSWKLLSVPPEAVLSHYVVPLFVNLWHTNILIPNKNVEGLSKYQ